MSGGSRKRVWLKALIVVALLLVVSALTVVLGVRRLDSWVSDYVSDRIGRPVVVTGVSASLRGDSTIEKVELRVSGELLVCSDIVIPGGLRALGARPLALIQVGACTLTPEVEVEVEDESEDSPRSFHFSSESMTPLSGVAAELRPWVDTVELSQASLQWGGYPQIQFERVRLRTAAPLTVEVWTRAPEFGIDLFHAQVRIFDDGAVSLRPLTPVSWRGLHWNWNALELRTLDQASVAGIVVTDGHGDNVARLAQVHFADDNGVWTVAASGGDVQVPSRDALVRMGAIEQVATPDDSGDADQNEEGSSQASAGPPEDEPGRTAAEVPACEGDACEASVRDSAATLDALIALAARVPELRERIRETRRPIMRLSLHDVRVNWNEIGLDVARLSLDEQGHLEGSVGLDAVQIGFSVDLATLETVELSANNLDLSPLAGTLGSTAVRGHMNVSGEVRLDDAQALSWEGRLEFSDAGFDWPAVAPTPVDDVNVVVTGSADIRWGASPSMSGDLSIDLGQAPLRLQSQLESGETGWQGGATLSLRETTRCQDLWESIPVGMLPNLGHASVTFAGETDLRLTADYLFGDPWSFDLVSELFPGTCTISRVSRQWDPAQLNSDVWTMQVTEGVTRSDIIVGPGSGSWVLLSSLPTYVPAAMYLSEEMGFYNGVGISLNLIRRAVALNIERGRYVYGGSTIMQQLVKNLFLSRAKTLSRKLEEAVLVWAMYERVSKDRILEYYINCIEFGPDVYGIEAASMYYFNKPPQWLTPLEAIFLANLKPAPRDGVNYLRRGHSPDRGWWPERTRTMLQRLADIGAVHPDEVEFYSPWVVALPASPAQPGSGYDPVDRPAWAIGTGEGSGELTLPAIDDGTMSLDNPDVVPNEPPPEATPPAQGPGTRVIGQGTLRPTQ